MSKPYSTTVPHVARFVAAPVWKAAQLQSKSALVTVQRLFPCDNFLLVLTTQRLTLHWTFEWSRRSWEVYGNLWYSENRSFNRLYQIPQKRYIMSPNMSLDVVALMKVFISSGDPLIGSNRTSPVAQSLFFGSPFLSVSEPGNNNNFQSLNQRYIP